MTAAKRTEAVLRYFRAVADVRDSGGGTAERSYYPALENLLNAVGDTLDPKVRCVTELADMGAGHPDMGLYSARQLRKGEDRPLPERGVVEVKPPSRDAPETAAGEQVRHYRGLYGLVLVTNLREFLLQEEGENGERRTLESFTLAASEEELLLLIRRTDAQTRKVRAGLGEFLYRALSHHAALTEPRFLAVQLASYARDALARVEEAGASPRLAAFRDALEDALGIQFEGERGDRLFRSTLVQTLWYGVFSAWVLWARERLNLADAGTFNWRETDWNLTVPVLAALFRQTASPAQLQPLGLVEVLDWTAATLDRVEKRDFFRRFNEGEAVPYFYEPFLEAFDPDLRKQLGVWYTPPEVVRYMVARVDRALKDDLGIAEGLAGENVYVLDPCCGTGAYLAEVLRRIDANLVSEGALRGSAVRKAAMERVIGFEIMPAPLVVAHLQVGLALAGLDAALPEGGDARPAIYLTNALTGWEPHTNKPLPFPELEEERDRTDEVKQSTPVLVILGNPPYNSFAGVAVAEERELSVAYRETKRVAKPEGHGLNDLYVRFFRMAERRIAEKTGRGVVCFISNYSWLDGLSHTGMRERYLETFDAIRIDNLHGDRIISEYAPDGRTSETVFALRGQSPGIKIGTSITLLSRSGPVDPAAGTHIKYRDFHEAKAEERRRALLSSLDAIDINAGYSDLQPDLRLGLPFKPAPVSEGWFEWPALPDLFPQSFPGVKTSRDSFLVDIDRDRLEARIADYFDADMDNSEIARRYPIAMKATARFDAPAIRNTLLSRGGPNETGFIRYAYRPFDNRWLYWESETKLLDEKRADYVPHVFEGNLWLSAAQHLRKGEVEPQACFTQHLGSLHLIERTALQFPARLRHEVQRDGVSTTVRRPNLSAEAQRYLEMLRGDQNDRVPNAIRSHSEPDRDFQGPTVEDLFHHVLATLHDPAYREENAGALRMGWPRIPCPGWPDGGEREESRATLLASAARGRELAKLLDVDKLVEGVTAPAIRPELAAIAEPTVVADDWENMRGEDFALTAGWGHFGAGEAVMPGQGRLTERPFADAERAAMGEAAVTLGDSTFDVYLNDRAYWRNVPKAVWEYKLGGYQVLKKWLSYRERKVLDRDMTPDEVAHFRDAARRIAAILLLTGR